MDPSEPKGLDPIAALAEPVRRRLYEFVVASGGPVDRDTAATGVGVGRPLAAFHLDRLASAGLLEVEYRRRTGRSGPGAGRPAKYYRRPSGLEISVSLPPRRYELAARILADGIDRRPEALGEVLESARRKGAAMAGSPPPASREELVDWLDAQGYEPASDADGVVRLRNCPFHALVAEHRPLVCAMNLALLDGVLARTQTTGLDPRAEPGEGRCCVALVPVDDQG